jgi:RNA polymerase sigma-70 factor (ECF subfamily)
MSPVEWPVSRTTLWNQVRDARDGRPTALNDLLGRYRPPVVSYLRGQGVTSEDAEDVAQEVLVALVEGGALDKAERARGRFRNLVIAVTRHQLGKRRRDEGRLKRGGGVATFSLDASGPLAAPDENDESFDRAWLNRLLELALDRLRGEHPEWHQVIDLHLNTDKSYRDIAATLGRTEDAVDNALRQGKAKLADYLRSEIEGYSDSTDDSEREQSHLFKYLVARNRP